MTKHYSNQQAQAITRIAVSSNNENLNVFQASMGSVTGRRHVGSGNLLAGRNNQDAFLSLRLQGALLISVFDGCGSTPFSDFGARLAAKVLPLAVKEALNSGDVHYDICSQDFLPRLKESFLRRIFAIVEVLCGDDPADTDEFIRTHLLFTVLSAIVTEKKTVVFGAGDGVFCINGEVTELGPFADNAPDYVCKGLLDSECKNEFSLHACLKTKELDSLILGTDGLSDLIANAGTFIPGKRRKVGSLNDLLVQDFLFSDIEDFEKEHGIVDRALKDHTDQVPVDRIGSLTGWLRLINSEVTRIGADEFDSPMLLREEGLLPDDTTLVVLRRGKKYA